MKKLLKKYGLHIIVEIFIIVAGVLIALQVNNWNELRKERIYTKGVLLKIMEDWDRDTQMINQFTKHYTPFIDGYNKVINKEVTNEYLDTCAVCKGLITNYIPFKMENNGINLLKKQVSSNTSTSANNIQSDSFIVDLIQSQVQIEETIQQMSQRIRDDVDNNVFDLTQKDWFADVLVERKITDPFREYYKSPEFRNRTARHKIFVESNILMFLKMYKKGIIREFPKLKEKYEQL